MKIIWKDRKVYNENGEQYISVRTFLKRFKESNENYNYVKYKTLMSRIEDEEKRKEIQKAIFFEKTATLDYYFNQLEDKTLIDIPLPEHKREPKVIDDLRYPNLLGKRLINPILYDHDYKLYSITTGVSFDKKGNFKLDRFFSYEKDRAFSSIFPNYKHPIEELNTSIASRYFLIANFESWFLEKFGYNCAGIKITHYNMKRKYVVPYVPRLVKKLLDYEFGQRK